LKSGGEPPEHGIPHATKTSGTFLNGAAGPKGGGQEARNKVVHRPQIQSSSTQMQNKFAQINNKTRSINIPI